MDKLIAYAYWYCTDFCANLANLLGISYDEFNIWLFMVVLPSLLSVLLALNIARYVVWPVVKRFWLAWKGS